MPDHAVIAPAPGSAVPHVGTYRRVLPVNLERMYENALDWAHLPHVHRSTFASVQCRDAGAWGWRADVEDPRGRRWTVELTLDRGCHRWITRNLDGAQSGAEIWTHAFELAPVQGAPRLQVVVDFFVPGVGAERRRGVGEAYARLYERLYDEDQDMMVQRQVQLDRRVESLGRARVSLGRRGRLNLPQVISLGGREFVVAELDERLVAYPSRCPHLLGPLQNAMLEAGQITCPWHGYRFDVTTGECVSGQACRLRPLPRVEIAEDGEVSVSIGETANPD